MNNKIKALFAAIALLAFGCHNKPEYTGTDYTISPESGSNYKAGDAVKVKVSIPADVKVDSVVYLMDSARIVASKDTSGISLKTDTLPLGIKVITAKVFTDGKSQDVSTNIVLLAAKAPQELTFKVEKVFPHDTSSYTEGLLYQNGVLYESDGGRLDEEAGQSSLRTADLETGKVIKKTDGDPDVFMEGIAVVGDKIVQLTYTEKIGYVYDKHTLKRLSTFNNNVGVEGWGMCYDGKKLYMDDSTNRVWFLDKDHYTATGYIDVYDDKGPINELNELEMIDGKLYANVYTSNDLLVIDPKTGAVLQRADMTNLWPLKDRPADFNSSDKVFNGIAWDAKGKRLFVTGKKWPHLYQVKLSPAGK